MPKLNPSAGASLQLVPNSQSSYTTPNCATHFGKLSEFAKVHTPLPLRHTLWQTFRVCQSSYTTPNCAPHFGKLSEFDKVHTPPPIAPHTLANFQSLPKFYPSSHTRLCQLADFPSLILRSSFAHPSLKVRWECELVGSALPPAEPVPPLAQACCLCPIQNSKFKILPSED